MALVADGATTSNNDLLQPMGVKGADGKWHPQAADASGGVVLSGAATTTVAIAASKSTDTVVKAAPGRLARLLVTALGTNALLIYDDAASGTGTIIGAVPASAAVGSNVLFDMPALVGITVKGNAANPAVTISFS